MRLFRTIPPFGSIRKPIVTIGTFDGVHRGHQEILRKLTESAHLKGGESVVVTFFPHPRTVLYKSENSLQLITSIKEKLLLLKEYGIDNVVILPFTLDFSHLSAESFVKQILVDAINVDTLILGFNHHFGFARSADFKEYDSLASKYNFDLEVIPEYNFNENAISSTIIRKLLLKGSVEKASEMLGHDYFIAGKIVKGYQIGNTLGFPTANVHFNEDLKLLPAIGAYAVSVLCKGHIYKGMLNIGHRPTVSEGKKTIEVNIFDFDSNIYKEEIIVYFKHRLRDEMKFASIDELKCQLNKDKQRALSLLSQ